MKPIARHNMAKPVNILPGDHVYNVNYCKGRVFLMYDKKTRLWSLPNEEKHKDDYDTYATISRLYMDILGTRIRNLKTITSLKNNSDVVIYKNSNILPPTDMLFMEWVPIDELENYNIDQTSLDIIAQEILT
jgi:hypothetical protein